MNSTEANRLLAHCAAFDNRKPSAAAAEAWAAALHDVPLDPDVLAAVARYYGAGSAQAAEQRWIQPHHVRAHRKAMRNARLEGFRYVPTDGDDDPKVYLASLRAQRQAVADGRREADPPQVEATKPRDIPALLAGAFRRPK